MVTKALREFQDTLTCPECGAKTMGYEYHRLGGGIVSAVHKEGFIYRKYYVERSCFNIAKHGLLHTPRIKFYLTKEQARFWKKNEFEIDIITVEAKTA